MEGKCLTSTATNQLSKWHVNLTGSDAIHALPAANVRGVSVYEMPERLPYRYKSTPVTVRVLLWIYMFVFTIPFANDQNLIRVRVIGRGVHPGATLRMLPPFHYW